jgi:hypothetical protein
MHIRETLVLDAAGLVDGTALTIMVLNFEQGLCQLVVIQNMSIALYE